MRREVVELDELARRYVEKRMNAPVPPAHELRLGDLAPAAAPGDPDLLLTALDNLVNNAERYSPAGAPITVSVVNKGKWAVLKVRDQGAGVTRRERRKIFALFYRGAAAAKSPRRGSGLGLYMVKGIAAMHRGKADVLSDGPGAGSTFRIWLPRVGRKEGGRP
jgi:two-component system sensor histidine kinase SenX3